ncbi:MAG TPA: aryl-sulfate sulfotransferase [Terriglobia bacterium]|nr:aryl-sulfate sulfotransferase [Terriglobia bacterium]
MTFSLRPLVVICLSLLIWISAPAATHDRTPPQFATNPTVTRNPNPRVPLASIVTFRSDKPAAVALQINDGRVFYADRELQTEHAVAILGLHAAGRNQVRIFLIDAAGNRSAPSVSMEILTDPLPADFPPIEARVHQTLRMEPGVTLFNIIRTDRGLSALLAVDGEGKVVWYYRGDAMITDARRLRNGNLLFLDGTDAVEMDMLGNVVRKWRPLRLGTAVDASSAVPVDVDTFHHELAELPWRNLLTLSTEVRRYDAYPSSETDPRAPVSSANVVGDVIVEFERDGRVVNQWRLLDLLSPYRIGYDSLLGFWDLTYRNSFAGTRDWAHANAVSYDASDDSFIVSLRHQDAVVKIARRTSQIVWILGTHNGWNAPQSSFLLQPAGRFEWPFHQHAPEMTSRGTLLLFDNGNNRAEPFEPKMALEESYSRAVEYRIDPRTRTVSQTWSYGGPGDEMFFSRIIGEADQLPLTKNILITDGARDLDANGNNSESDSGTTQWARIVEVTYTQPAEKVLELVIGDPSRLAIVGWLVYRSERLPSLYPPDRIPTPPLRGKVPE